MSYVYDTNKKTLQNAISDYFGNAIMTKVRDYENNYSLYYAKMINLYYSEDKYIIAIVKSDFLPIGTKQNLRNLDWISLQTRVIDTLPYHIKSQNVKSILSQPLTDKINL